MYIYIYIYICIKHNSNNHDSNNDNDNNNNNCNNNNNNADNDKVDPPCLALHAPGLGAAPWRSDGGMHDAYRPRLMMYELNIVIHYTQIMLCVCIYIYIYMYIYTYIMYNSYIRAYTRNL